MHQGNLLGAELNRRCGRCDPRHHPAHQDINAHTSEVVRAIEQQELATGEISHDVASAAAGARAVVAALGDVASGVTQREAPRKPSCRFGRSGKRHREAARRSGRLSAHGRWPSVRPGHGDCSRLSPRRRGPSLHFCSRGNERNTSPTRYRPAGIALHAARIWRRRGGGVRRATRPARRPSYESGPTSTMWPRRSSSAMVARQPAFDHEHAGTRAVRGQNDDGNALEGQAGQLTASRGSGRHRRAKTLSFDGHGRGAERIA